jgi:Tol biopolymer transport system component
MRGLALLLLALAAAAPAARAQQPTARFLGLALSALGSSHVPPAYALVFASADGTGLVRSKGSFDAVTLRASWAPDGARVVVASHRSPVPGEVLVVDAATAAVTRLTVDAAPDRVENTEPVWSPDGAWIAWTKALGQAPPKVHDLWIMRPDGTGQRRLGDGSSPSWSADGKLLAFARGDELWTIRPDGTGPQRLAASGSGLQWSPAGHELLYCCTRGDPTDDVHVVDADGGADRLLARGAYASDGIAWSPDGTRVAFSRDGGRRRELVVVAVKGGETRVVRRAAWDQRDVAWSPDGRWLTWSEQRSLKETDTEDVFAASVDDGGAQRLTGPLDPRDPGGLASTSPRWWPDGSRISFARGGDEFGRSWEMNADGSCETRFPLDVGIRGWAPGAAPGLGPLRCADLSVLSRDPTTAVRHGAAAVFELTISNDGNEAASPRLAVTTTSGTIALRGASCTTVGRTGSCRLRALAPRASAHVTVSVRSSRAGALLLVARVARARGDDAVNNTARGYATVRA